MDQWLASVIVALITAAGAIMVARVEAGRTAKKIVDEKEIQLEHRLTVLEVNQFSKEDKECLQSLKVKMDFFLDFYVKEAAVALKNPPQLRAVLASMETDGYSILKTLSVTELEDLREYLDEQLTSPNDEKRQYARMLKGLLNMEQSVKEACVTPPRV